MIKKLHKLQIASSTGMAAFFTFAAYALCGVTIEVTLWLVPMYVMYADLLYNVYVAHKLDVLTDRCLAYSDKMAFELETIRRQSN